MTKKIDQFLGHWIIGERILLWFNVSPSSLTIGIVLVDKLAESRLCGFALAFDRHAKSLAFNFNAYSSNCISEVSCLFVVLVVVVQVRDQFIQAMRNSDP